MYALKKTNACNLGTWWSKNHEAGNPVFSVVTQLLSGENISGESALLYLSLFQTELENTGY